MTDAFLGFFDILGHKFHLSNSLHAVSVFTYSFLFIVLNGEYMLTFTCFYKVGIP